MIGTTKMAGLEVSFSTTELSRQLATLLILRIGVNIMKFNKVFIIGVLTLFASLSTASAQSAVKTWVSSGGSDRGQCDIGAPCGSIQYALNQTVAGGEVEVRDPGNYGPFYISRSVSVISSTGGATLSDYGNGNAGISLQPGANDIVTIRGFTINGHNASGTTGIAISSGGTVIIDHCIISGANWDKCHCSKCSCDDIQ